MTQITYNTPSWAVSDLQSPPPRALRALGIGDCKSDTALLYRRVITITCSASA